MEPIDIPGFAPHVDMDRLPYVHPSLTIELSPSKGRLVSTTGRVARGEIILIDEPNALVPAMRRDDPPFLLCSRAACRRRLPRAASSSPPPPSSSRDPTPVKEPVSCPERCIEEVAWCNDRCREQDAVRHGKECRWLRETAAEIREGHGDSDFGLVWLIARILIARSVEDETPHQKPPETTPPDQDNLKVDSHFGRRGWEAVWNLEGSPDAFPSARIAHWRDLTRRFLCHGSLGVGYHEDEILSLICKVETNSFGLYPGVTGVYPPPHSHATRGEYYGAGVYPTAAMFNHACCPNVTHQVDELGRRVFRAGRDVDAGEECCITYFDLAEYVNPTARRDAIRASWDFVCSCRRCEEDFDVPDFLKMMDMS